MDQIFDRLGNLLKSILQENEDDGPRPSRNTKFSDPDLQDAWDELDDFMKTGNDAGESQRRADFREMPGKPGIPQELTKDFQLLGVAHTAEMQEIAKAYKKLLSKHHPDRHASDPEAFARATENAKRISASFQRIKQYKTTGKA